jgi:hypothetical protein
MKSLAVGFVAGAAVASAASALAFSSAGHGTHLAPGESAYIESGGRQTTCQAIVKGGVNTFSCFAGFDQYRARYSATINGKEVTVSKYLGPGKPKPYKVMFHVYQGPTLIAH